MPRLLAGDLIVGIDPTSRGFAFAVLEAPSFLVDWGERIVSSKSGALLRKVDELLTYHEPAVLVVEDAAAKGCRRRERGREEIRRIERLATARGIRVARVSRLAVRDTLARGKSKYEVALRLAQVFPVLADRLPKRRKAWMTEDQRMNTLDALGLAAVLVAGARAARPGDPVGDPGERGDPLSPSGWGRPMRGLGMPSASAHSEISGREIPRKGVRGA
jgi:hypothetical protein